jgi:hypothetical protein
MEGEDAIGDPYKRNWRPKDKIPGERWREQFAGELR